MKSKISKENRVPSVVPASSSTTASPSKVISVALKFKSQAPSEEPEPNTKSEPEAAPTDDIIHATKQQEENLPNPEDCEEYKRHLPQLEAAYQHRKRVAQSRHEYRLKAIETEYEAIKRQIELEFKTGILAKSCTKLAEMEQSLQKRKCQGGRTGRIQPPDRRESGKCWWELDLERIAQKTNAK